MGKKNKKILTIFACFCLCLMSAFFGVANSNNLVNSVYATEVVDPSVDGGDETGTPTEDPTDTPSGESGSGSGEENLDGEEGVEEEEETIDYSKIFSDGFKLTDSDMPDANLRDQLLKLFKSKTEYKDIDAIYSTMFNHEVFDSIVIDNKNITSLHGMELLEFEYLQSISLNWNAITNFSSNYLRNATDKLESISLAGNNLSAVDFSRLYRLTYVDVSSNKLSKIDLSHVVVAESGTDIYVNVAGNNFTTMKNILLPEHRIGVTTLNVVGNAISDFETKYFDGTKYIMSIGVQNLKDAKVDTATTVDFYKINIPGVAIEVRCTDGGVDTLQEIITDEVISESGYVLSRKYPIGEYYFNYTLNGTAVPSKSFYDSGKFSIIPQMPKVTYTYKNKTTDSLGKVTGKVTVNLSTGEEGAKIYYKLNGQDEWIEGNTIKCENGGSYSIKVKAVVVTESGRVVESEINELLVRTSLNLYISDTVMLVIVALIALTLFFVVIPIISKKYFKKD